MQTQAHEFFQLHVVPNLEAWSSNSTDIRLAMNVAVSLFHMADHFWHTYSIADPVRVFNTKSPAAFRLELSNRYPYFMILRDVAEAHKHMKLDRPKRLLTQANQTAVGATGFGESGFGTGPFGGGPSVVVVLNDGTKHHLSFFAEEVKQLWLSFLK
jgi:hypothetical protein